MGGHLDRRFRTALTATMTAQKRTSPKRSTPQRIALERTAAKRKAAKQTAPSPLKPRPASATSATRAPIRKDAPKPSMPVESGRVVYAYCVVSESTPPDLSTAPAGMPGADHPRLVALAPRRFLVVADAPEERYGEEAIERGLRDLAWVSACAVAHEQVIEHFLASPALLPMKLFTVFSSETAARAAMKRGARRTAGLLDRLAGHVECGVRVRFLAPPGNTAPAAASTLAGSGRAFLEAKKQSRDARRTAVTAAAGAVGALRQALEARAAETRALEPPEGVVSGGLLLDAAYLVPRNAVGAFEAVLAQHGAELQKLGCEVVLTGPWPAYHFLEDPPKARSAGSQSARSGGPGSARSAGPRSARRPGDARGPR